MKLHAQAALTIKQRQEVHRLHREDHVSIRRLAQRFRVNPTTIVRWVHREAPLDLSSAPWERRSVITPDYRAAVVSYRHTFPHHGPIRIAQELHREFPQAHRGTVLSILQQEGLTRPPTRRSKAGQPIPVGRHRIQMDVQQLPAIHGGKGFEYKITAIHLRTRLKYSEIHDNRASSTVAGVLKRALDLLPPFFSSGPTTPGSSR
jgi:helix-turn-helix protein